MKKNNFKYLLLSILAISLLPSYSFSQQQFKINSSASKLIISGTSTIHDWEIEAENFSCDATISLKGNSIEGISNVNFSVPVKDIKSHNRIMDNKTYNALNSDKYPDIKFALNDPKQENLNGNNSSVKGILTINNIRKEVEIDFSYQTVNQNQIKINGEIPLKMSDFDVVPPTAMLGTLTTGNEIKVTYEILLDNTHKIN